MDQLQKLHEQAGFRAVGHPWLSKLLSCETLRIQVLLCLLRLRATSPILKPTCWWMMRPAAPWLPMPVEEMGRFVLMLQPRPYYGKRCRRCEHAEASAARHCSMTCEGYRDTVSVPMAIDINAEERSRRNDPHGPVAVQACRLQSRKPTTSCITAATSPQNPARVQSEHSMWSKASFDDPRQLGVWAPRSLKPPVSTSDSGGPYHSRHR